MSTHKGCYEFQALKAVLVTGAYCAGSQTLQLKDNYRSTPQVLRGAEGVLNNILSTGGAAARMPLVPYNAGGPQIEAGNSPSFVAFTATPAHAYAVHCMQSVCNLRMCHLKNWGISKNTVSCLALVVSHECVYNIERPYSAM